MQSACSCSIWGADRSGTVRQLGGVGSVGIHGAADGDGAGAVDSVESGEALHLVDAGHVPSGTVTPVGVVTSMDSRSPRVSRPVCSSSTKNLVGFVAGVERLHRHPRKGGANLLGQSRAGEAGGGGAVPQAHPHLRAAEGEIVTEIRHPGELGEPRLDPGRDLL